MSEKLHKLKKDLSEKDIFETPELRWKFRKKRTPYIRWKIIEAINEAKEPLSAFKLSYLLGLNVQTLRAHLNTLVAANVICDRLEPANAETDERGHHLTYYSICPICPISSTCEFKERMVFKEESEA